MMPRLILPIFLISLLILAGCKDPCDGVQCVNGTCDNDAACICAEGYEGAACDTRLIAKFLGNFSGEESCTSGDASYTVSIQEDPLSSNINGIKLDNIYNSGREITAIVLDSIFTVSSQPLGNGTISGTGTISSDNSIVTMEFNVTTGPISDDCVLTLTRQ